MLDYRDISLMESVPLLWRTVTASPVGTEPMTILEGGAPPHGLAPQYPPMIVLKHGELR